MTTFENIYELVRKIPKGFVATYGQVAEYAGNPRWARVVGYALHVNPQPYIIPCHRVVGANGNLTGYAGGLGNKIRLLTLEKADIGKFFMPKTKKQ